MGTKSAKRAITPREEENAPPLNQSKRSKALDQEFVTPKTRRSVLTPRSSNVTNCTTPTVRRKTLPRRSEFHGIPGNPSKTLVITESVKTATTVGPPRQSVSTYFTHRKRSVRKNERTFADLGIPRLSLRQFEKSFPITTTLDEEVNEQTFKEWKTQIALGHNVLVYGFGSNVELLDAFGKSKECSDGAALAFDAFEGWTAADIITECAKFYFKERDFKKASVKDMIEIISEDSRKMYVLINSIDAVTLRKKQEQVILAKLARCPNVTMVASIQHVNGCILWNTSMFAAFDWSLYAIHTCQHYIREAADRPLILNPTKESKEGEGTCAETALNILKSLVRNAQQVFLLLAQQKLTPVPLTTPLKSIVGPNTQRRSSGISSTLGMPFDVLYKSAKERFLVSNASVLKSHIEDFITHDLLIVKTDDQGKEYYMAAADNEDLEKIMKGLGHAG